MSFSSCHMSLTSCHATRGDTIMCALKIPVSFLCEEDEKEPKTLRLGWSASKLLMDAERDTKPWLSASVPGCVCCLRRR